MEAKLVVALALVALVHSAPQSNFSYKVADEKSGDFKTRTESRVGDVVSGHYSLQEPDGTKRIVHYVADEDGFNAVVRKCPADWARLSANGPPITAEIVYDSAAASASAAGPEKVAVRAPIFVPGIVDSRLYPAHYNAGQAVVPSWPYAPLLK